MSTSHDEQDTRPDSADPPIPSVQVFRASPERPRPWYSSMWVIIAYSACLMSMVCVIGFVPYWDTFRENLQKTVQILSGQALPSQTTVPVVEVSPTASILEADPVCVIVWVEHPADDLGKKSRAAVWEQKVSADVKASGMTPRKFYDLVVEHNPQLIQDDYEFKKGQKYLLPECQ